MFPDHPPRALVALAIAFGRARCLEPNLERMTVGEDRAGPTMHHGVCELGARLLVGDRLASARRACDVPDSGLPASQGGGDRADHRLRGARGRRALRCSGSAAPRTNGRAVTRHTPGAPRIRQRLVAARQRSSPRRPDDWNSPAFRGSDVRVSRPMQRQASRASAIAECAAGRRAPGASWSPVRISCHPNPATPSASEPCASSGGGA